MHELIATSTGIHDRWWVSPLERYVLAVAVVAAAALTRWALPAFLTTTPFLAFYPAVVVAAAMGGFGPGLVATLGSELCYALWFDPSQGGFQLSDAGDWGRVVIFLAGGVGVSFLAKWQRASEQRARLLIVQTERKHGEQRLSLMIDAVKEYAIFMLDSQGRVISWNSGAQRIKGYEARQIIGENFSRFYMPEDIAADKPRHDLEVAARDGHHTEEGWRVRRDGSRFWASVTITAVRGEDGQLQGFSKVTRDMTERMLAEQRLQQTTDELARSNAELQQFAYVASHDLQEPLRAIAGCVQLLQQRLAGKLDSRAEEFISHAVDGANRMRALITDLLEYSRVGTRAREFQPTDCNEAFKVALHNLQTAIQEKQAVVTSDTLPTLTADPTQMMQLLQNLIGNALKFSGTRPPQIHIGTQRVDGSWQFAVRDNGIGIEPQYRERIFGVFQRLHTRREYPGTGIGLAICKRIVERHGGRIWVESQTDQGSTFYFTFPIRSEP